MKPEDFNNELEMRQLAQDLFEKLRQARRMLLRINTTGTHSDRVQYKAAIQWLDSAIEQLTFEK